MQAVTQADLAPHFSGYFSTRLPGLRRHGIFTAALMCLEQTSPMAMYSSLRGRTMPKRRSMYSNMARNTSVSVVGAGCTRAFSNKIGVICWGGGAASHPCQPGRLQQHVAAGLCRLASRTHSVLGVEARVDDVVHVLQPNSAGFVRQPREEDWAAAHASSRH